MFVTHTLHVMQSLNKSPPRSGMTIKIIILFKKLNDNQLALILQNLALE